MRMANATKRFILTMFLRMGVCISDANILEAERCRVNEAPGRGPGGAWHPLNPDCYLEGPVGLREAPREIRVSPSSRESQTAGGANPSEPAAGCYGRLKILDKGEGVCVRCVGVSA